MLRYNHERVLADVRRATTEDLLDRVTAYRAAMEPEALDLIEAELRSRGVTAAQVADHDERCRREVLFGPDGVAARCSRKTCHRPAVAEGWAWHRLWGRLPLFPRFYRYCAEHPPGAGQG
jgi:hypothetical protein